MVNALKHWKEDGSFDDVDFDAQGKDGWDGIRHWEYLRTLAWAWADPQSYRYHNKELGRRIVQSVIFWHRVRPCPPLKWWWNQVGVPMKAMDALILACPLLQQTEEGCKALLTPLQGATLKTAVGENLTWQAEAVFLRGLLAFDNRMMDEAAAVLTKELRIAAEGQEGIAADGCYHWNGHQIQQGTYGLEFLEHAVSYAMLVNGTSWGLNESQMNAVRKLMLDGFAWILWRGRMDYHGLGVKLGGGSQQEAAAKAMRNLRRLAEFDGSYRRAYETVLMGNEKDGVNAFVGARAYWKSDFAVIRQPGYYVSLRMTSKRTRPVEDDVASLNQLGRYFSDGSLQLLITGDEYKDMPAYWKWTRLPGTTLPDSPVLKRGQGDGTTVSFGRPPRWTGEENFTGAVSSGLHLAAVYKQNVDGVTALKSYFFAPGAIVCLGAAISSESPYPVETTVEQRRLHGTLIGRPGGIWHDNVAYLGEGLLNKVEKVNGRWDFVTGQRKDADPKEIEMLTIGIAHGTGCRGGHYAYEIRPGVSMEDFSRLKLSGSVLSNTSNVQAVAFVDGAVGVVFHRAGRFGDFETDTPCVMLLEDGKMFVIDPTHLVKQMKIAYKGRGFLLTMPDGEKAGLALCIDVGQ